MVEKAMPGRLQNVYCSSAGGCTKVLSNKGIDVTKNFIPVFSSKFAKQGGVEYRAAFADSNSYFLESLNGIKEILLFDKGEDRKNAINENSEKLHEKMGVIKGHEGIIRAFTDIVIMIAILTFLFVSIKLNEQGQITIGQGLVAIVTLASSFGPVVALSNLSNNLIQTFACAQRLFDILDEVPAVEEVDDVLVFSIDNIIPGFPFTFV